MKLNLIIIPILIIGAVLYGIHKLDVNTHYGQNPINYTQLKKDVKDDFDLHPATN